MTSVHCVSCKRRVATGENPEHAERLARHLGWHKPTRLCGICWKAKYEPPVELGPWTTLVRPSGVHSSGGD